MEESTGRLKQFCNFGFGPWWWQWRRRRQRTLKLDRVFSWWWSWRFRWRTFTGLEGSVNRFGTSSPDSWNRCRACRTDWVSLFRKKDRSWSAELVFGRLVPVEQVERATAVSRDVQLRRGDDVRRLPPAVVVQRRRLEAVVPPDDGGGGVGSSVAKWRTPEAKPTSALWVTKFSKRD